MYGNPGPFTYSPRGFSPDDLPQQRRDIQHEEHKGSPAQWNGITRPSGKSIYMQRKEYSERLNTQSDNFHVRVEHLFTCELDGKEVKKVDDCVAKLKRLEAKGRLWSQEMVMEIQGGQLQLSDIESKIELESLPLSGIMQTKAILDSCSYNSLLAITVKERNKHVPRVYMFQCEEIRANLLKDDLDKVVKTRGDDVEPYRDQANIRDNLENILGQHSPTGYRPVQREMTLPPPHHPPTQWANREPERDYFQQEEMLQHPDLHDSQSNPERSSEPMITRRNTDILNHVIEDVEIFMGKMPATAPPQQAKKKSKKNQKNRKSNKNASADGQPTLEEYISCLGKIKYGLNLLGQLDGELTNPSAPDFVHIFFSILATIVPRYNADLPPTVFSPLLKETTLRLLSEVVSPVEDALWKSLGDPWNIPSFRWPEGDIPPYIPQFYDGWSPTALPQVSQVRRAHSQRYPSDRPDAPLIRSQSFSSSAMQGRPEQPAWNPPPPPSFSLGEPPTYMRVIYNFVARNNQELSIMKGDVVQVIQKTKQWWLVRNGRNEEGNVPQNVLEPMQNSRPMDDIARDTRGPVTLDLYSTSADVKAWLQSKGFSKITVTSLGVLTGRLLLGMTMSDIKTVCPEEGGKVFFQLQAFKSAIALASESSGQYNGRY